VPLPSGGGYCRGHCVCEIWFSQVGCWKCSYHTSCNVWLVVGGYHIAPNCMKGGGLEIIKEYLERHGFSSCNRGCVSELKDY